MNIVLRIQFFFLKFSYLYDKLIDFGSWLRNLCKLTFNTVAKGNNSYPNHFNPKLSKRDVNKKKFIELNCI